MSAHARFGDYTLLERIHVGATSEVFTAEYRGAGGVARPVAVKRLLPGPASDRALVTQFLDAAARAAALDHVGLVATLDHGLIAGLPYAALEMVDGRSLRALGARHLAAGRPPRIAEACFVMMQLCEALEYVHARARVHRGVSALSVLVSFDGTVKLGGFGGVPNGAPGYASPEQQAGHHGDRRSDVFACGVLLLEFLTGDRGFLADAEVALTETVRDLDHLASTVRSSVLPDALVRIVMRAMARDPAERPRAAGELHKELARFVALTGARYDRAALAESISSTFASERAAVTQFTPRGPRDPSVSSVVRLRVGADATHDSALWHLQEAARDSVLADREEREGRTERARKLRFDAARNYVDAVHKALFERLSQAFGAEARARWWQARRVMDTRARGSHERKLDEFLERNEFPSLIHLAKWLEPPGPDPADLAEALVRSCGLDDDDRHRLYTLGAIRNVLMHRIDYEVDHRRALGPAVDLIGQELVGSGRRLTIDPVDLVVFEQQCRHIIC